MTKISIPNPERKRALVLVDIQDGFVNDRNRWIISNIQKVLKEGEYTLTVEANFHAEKGSLWDRKTQWTFPLSPTIPQIKALLGQNNILVTKTTKSVFKGNQDILWILKEKGVEEIHIVGLDTNDCVFATAQEAFDLGFFTYVIEECTETSEDVELRESALKILRHLEMTNHSPIMSSRKTI